MIKKPISPLSPAELKKLETQLNKKISQTYGRDDPGAKAKTLPEHQPGTLPCDLNREAIKKYTG